MEPGALLQQVGADSNGGALSGIAGVFLEGKPEDGESLAINVVEEAGNDALGKPKKKKSKIKK